MRFSNAKTFLGAGIAAVLLSAPVSVAETVYQEPRAFLEEVFQGAVPDPSFLRVIGEKRKVAAAILGHAPAMLRVRFWRHAARSAWILEEIGKTQPITAGFVIENGQLEDVRILIYRESHGDEVRYDFFTKQFEGATRQAEGKLDRTIDGISGATLSVNAIRRLAELALYFEEQSNPKLDSDKN